jgi:hypothetical protein
LEKQRHHGDQGREFAEAVSHIQMELHPVIPKTRNMKIQAFQPLLELQSVSMTTKNTLLPVQLTRAQPMISTMISRVDGFRFSTYFTFSEPCKSLAREKESLLP